MLLKILVTLYVGVRTDSNDYHACDMDDLKHAEKGDEMEYRPTGVRTFSTMYKEVWRTNCNEAFINFTDFLLRETPKELSDFVNFDSLIRWAKKDPKRITWLLEKGYIEKVER